MAEIASVLASGILTTGPKVLQLEHAIAGYLGVKHAIAVSSGTAALHLALLALGIQPGDEVIIPDFSFPATANSVRLAGATPICCDIDPTTFNIDPIRIKRLIGRNTKALMPVHQFGLAAEMASIMELSLGEEIAVVEDAACALGAEFRTQKCGTWGKVACFSFHPRKIVTTGEGGLVVTSDDAIADKVRSLRNHGRVGKAYAYVGFNYRLSDVLAAIGLAQFAKLPRFITQRREVAGRYNQYLKDTPGLTLPSEPEAHKHTYQSYVVILDRRFDRDRIIEALKLDGIEAGIGTYAIHLLNAYKGNREIQKADLSASEYAHCHTLSLPMYPAMTAEEVVFVCDSLGRHLTRGSET